MNDKVSDPNGNPTDDAITGDVDNSEKDDDNSIRSLLEAQLSDSDESPKDDDSDDPTATATGADEPTVDDSEPAPPQSWTEAEREAWNELPDIARDAISRREKEYDAGLKSDAELQKVVAPIGESLEGTGVHVDEFVAGLVRGNAFIQTNPLEAALEILERNNLTAEATAKLNGSNSGEPARNADGDDKVAKLEERIAQNERAAQYQAELAEATKEWNAFVAATPDAEPLAEVIATKIGVNPRLSYAEAYKEAKKLVQTVNGSKTKADEAAEIEAATRASEKGKLLDLPRGKSGAPSAPVGTGSLREDIKDAMRATGYR